MGAKATPQMLKLFKAALQETGFEDPDANANKLTTKQGNANAPALPSSDTIKPHCRIPNPLEDMPIRALLPVNCYKKPTV